MIEHGLLQEIEEDLQRQKYEKLWKQYGHLVLAAALAIVLITAFISGWRSWTAYSEHKATAGLLRLVEGKAEDKARQIEGLEAFARANPGAGQSVLARLNAAKIALKEGKTEQAVAIYDAMANDAGLETPFRQLGDLMSAQIQLDTSDPAALKARLMPLVAGGVWRVTAKEFTALLDLRTGDKEEAKKFYTEITQDKESPESAIQRANDMLRWLNGGA
jgi:hypothetical protein